MCYFLFFYSSTCICRKLRTMPANSYSHCSPLCLMRSELQCAEAKVITFEPQNVDELDKFSHEFLTTWLSFEFHVEGILTEEEKNILKDLPSTHPKYWVPCVWFINLVRMTRKQGRIVSDPAMKTIVDVSIPRRLNTPGHVSLID